MLLLHCFVKGNSQCNLGKKYFRKRQQIVWVRYFPTGTHPNFGLQSLLKPSVSDDLCLLFICIQPRSFKKSRKVQFDWKNVTYLQPATW